MILGYPASAAFYLASFSDWFHRFLYPALSILEAIPYWVSGLLVLRLLIGVNLKGTEETGLLQIVAGLKVALILLFLYGGLQAFDASVIADSFAANATAFGQIGQTTALVFITFFGFEAIATNAEEIERPGENIPRAIFFSMGFVAVVYTFVVIVVVLAARARIEAVADRLTDAGIAVETTLVERSDAIVLESGDHDLTVLGASREGFFEKLVFGAIPEEVAREAESTVVMAKRNRGVLGRLRESLHRWLR